LRGAIATQLNADIKRVPDPSPLFGDPDWLSRYDAELRQKLGLRLEEFPKSCCPPLGHGLWIAVLDSGDVNHAVLARDGLVYHDPNRKELNGNAVPRDRLMFGLRLLRVPAMKTLTTWPGAHTRP
jgi:hypothetical protein